MSKNLELYKFCNDKEMSWCNNELVIWINFSDLDEFTQIVGRSYLCEGGVEVNLQNGCIALDIVPICEYLGVEPIELKEKE